MLPSPPDIRTLQRLRPLAQFDNDQLQQLANCLHVQEARKGDKLIEMGTLDEFSLFVLEGSIALIARDGKVKEVNIAADEELNPIAQLRPCMYDVVARSPLRFVRIDKSLLNEFAQNMEEGEEDISVHMIESDAQTNELTMHLYQDLLADKISLPSLPEVAHKIQQAFTREDLDASIVVNILATDPAITGKLIKVANSALYAGQTTTDTLQAAVVRLGLDTTYQLVMAYAANELFSSQSENVRQRMQQLWMHCRKTAAISRLLAGRVGQFNPEQAMLAGLMHDLGVIVILEYLDQHVDDLSRPEQIEDLIRVMRPQITGMLMQKWNFSEEVVAVAEECEEWFRNPRGDADLCDLVLVAQVHAQMGEASIHDLPPLAKMPAMVKLKLEPKDSIELIKQSKAEIAEIERLLH